MHLEARVKELAFQLHQNSHHSSRPPSADSYRKAPALSRAKGGPIGGKKGHDGGPLKMVDIPDKIIDHQQDVCVHGGKVHVQEPLTLRTRRQVFDIPQPHLEVTEHRVLDWVCGSCQQHNPGVFPARVSAPTQYGLRLQTPGVLFNSAYNIPRNKVQLIIQNLYGATLHTATLQNHQEFADGQSSIPRMRGVDTAGNSPRTAKRSPVEALTGMPMERTSAVPALPPTRSTN